MITKKQVEIATERYEEMKHLAGVPVGKEYLKIVDGVLLPCSRDEYLQLKIDGEERG